MKRDFLDLSSLEPAELDGLLRLGIRLKAELKSGLEHPYLRGKTLAMIFQKPSLRTRITFETGMAQLGGHAIYLAPQDIGIGERESAKDVARNLSRWVDLIMIRTFAHATCVELAREASVPVINGLTDLLHPCQLLADLMTLRERFGELHQLKIAFVGDGFNLAQSWIEAAARNPLRAAHRMPAELRAGPRLRRAPEAGKGRTRYARCGRSGDATPTWFIPIPGPRWGRRAKPPKRRREFKDFQVNRALMKHAEPGAVVMHCLPAHRGEEITDELLDGAAIGGAGAGRKSAPRAKGRDGLAAAPRNTDTSGGAASSRIRKSRPARTSRVGIRQ